MYHYAKAILPEASGYLPNDGPASRDLVVFAADRSALRGVAATLRQMAADIDKYLDQHTSHQPSAQNETPNYDPRTGRRMEPGEYLKGMTD